MLREAGDWPRRIAREGVSGTLTGRLQTVHVQPFMPDERGNVTSEQVRPAIDSRGSGHRLTAKLVLPVLAAFMLLTTAWALATPLMAVPDEPAHYVRAAAVAYGQPIGAPDDFSRDPVVRVPDFIGDASLMTCSAGNVTATGDCQAPVEDNNTMVEKRTSASPNSPIYYAMVGWPVLFLDGATALYAMRIVSALLTSLLLTTMVVALLAQSRTWWPVVASVVGVTPMVLFLGGSVNPNAPEMAAAGAVLALLTLMLRRPLLNRQLWLAGSLTIASAFALTSGRPIAMLWLAIIGVVAILSVPWSTVADLLKRRVIWFTLAGIATAAVACLAWVVYYGSVTTADAPATEPRAPGTTAIVLLMFENTFDYWTGWIGQFGWLEYQAPAGVMVVWFGAICAVLFSGFVLTRGRPRLAFVCTALVALIVPPAVQGSFYNDIGMMWQGRYSLALYLCVLILAGLALDEAFPRSATTTTRKVVVAGIALLGVVQIATFAFVLRRYVVGTQSWVEMIRHPAWQPPLGWIALVLVVVLTWVGIVALVVRWTRRTPDNETLPQPDAAFSMRS